VSRGPRADASLRARRWDVLVLGSALPGLVAALRLAQAGLRVMIAEEDTAARTPAALREPFLLPGGFGAGALDACLRAVGAPLIERRGLVHDEVAYQVLLPETRVEVGGRERTAQELVAWGLAKPEEAEVFIAALEKAAAQALEHLLEGGMLRRGLRGLGRGGSTRPGVVSALPPLSLALDEWADVQLRGLSGLAVSQPSSEAALRLLGAGLAGAQRFPKPGDGLRALLRRRLTALHVEFRTLGCPFRLVELGPHPGLARLGPQDVWLGRALLLNAPAPCLGAALRRWEQEVPPFLEAPAPTHRRLSLQLRALQEVVPEPLAPRALLAPAEPGGGPSVITLAQYPSSRGSRFAELVASGIVPDEPDQIQAQAAAMEEAVRQLMPFSAQRLRASPLSPRPLWDDEDAVLEPPPGSAWPAPLDIHVAGRRPVYHLHRKLVRGVGVEGELLLGWRAGDLIAEELA